MNKASRADLLQNNLGTQSIDVVTIPRRYTLGWVGWCGYVGEGRRREDSSWMKG